MRRYLIALVVIAVLVGSLFRASAQTGVRLMNMFATLGIFLFGVVGTMALTRWQSSAGVRELQAELKSLEPAWLITDWLYQGGGRPDYLLIGPGGLVAICLDETPQSAWKRRFAANLVRSRQRALDSVRWLRNRLTVVAPELQPAAGDLAPELPVAAVLVLNRRKAEPDNAAGGVTVVNAEGLAAHIRSLWDQNLLDERTRVRLTRALRGESEPAGKVASVRL